MSARLRRHIQIGRGQTFLILYMPWDWYWRVNGWGLSFRIDRDDWRSFSERNGYIKVHRWGPIGVQVLRPCPPLPVSSPTHKR